MLHPTFIFIIIIIIILIYKKGRDQNLSQTAAATAVYYSVSAAVPVGNDAISGGSRAGSVLVGKKSQ